MLTRLAQSLIRLSSGPAALTALLVFVLFGALALPGQSRDAARYSGGAGSPDTSFFYTPADLQRMAETYGAEGRAAYIRARWQFDILFPIIYTAFLVTAMGWASARAFRPDSRARLVVLLPLAGAIFDLLENLSAALYMALYPPAVGLLAVLAPVFTMLKWLSLYAAFGLLAGMLVSVIWGSLKPRKS